MLFSFVRELWRKIQLNYHHDFRYLSPRILSPFLSVRLNTMLFPEKVFQKNYKMKYFTEVSFKPFDRILIKLFLIDPFAVRSKL